MTARLYAVRELLLTVLGCGDGAGMNTGVRTYGGGCVGWTL